MAPMEGRQRLLHPVNWTAKHGLHRVGDQSIFHGNDKVDEFEVLFQPAPDAVFQIVQVFEDNGALTSLIEGQDRIAAERQHSPAQLPADLRRQQVAIESLSLKRASNRAV